MVKRHLSDKKNILHEQPSSKISKNESKNTADVDLIAQLDSIFLVKHSPTLIKFWNSCSSINPKSPTEAFDSINSLKLIGPFRFLNDLNKSTKKNKNFNYLCIDRFSTDLPEMQTFAIYQGGRFCFWRDLPDEEPIFIVNISNDKKLSSNFPIFTIAGNEDPLSAISFLTSMKKQKLNTIFEKIRKQPEMMSKLKIYQDKKFLEGLKKKRNQITLGKPLHGLGINVKVVKDVGYRPVTENTKKLRDDIIAFATVKDEAQKAVLKQNLLQIYSYVQFANDEMDFGMGLEFGHDLFISNYECFDGMAKSVLEVVYGLLNREVFTKILQAQWENGRRSNDKALIV